MIVDVSKRILIVGLGLLGGSYARVLKRFGFHISAITMEQSSIDYAIAENIIDEGAAEPDARIIGEADLVIFALYPHVFVEWIEQHQHLLKSGALITDVTGVKGSIVYKIQDMLRPDVEFIAAHPMAGREVSGVENSTDKLFIGANYIVTPTKKNTPGAIQTCMELGRLLGKDGFRLDYFYFRKLCRIFLSQLTHCIAITLMTCNDKEDMEKFTGDSFRDLTRIARINDLMWSELFVANKAALLEQMNLFIDKFLELRTMLETEDIDGMRRMMRHSTERRALFDKK